MKTLLHICELEDGSLRFYGASFSGIECKHPYFGRYIHDLKRAPWTAQFWIGLFGAAQQLNDLGIGPISSEPEYNYYEENECLPDWDECIWQTSESDSASNSQNIPETDSDRQKKKMAVSTDLLIWRQKKAVF